MKIGLCDDDEKIRDMVKGWLNKRHPEICPNSIIEFSCGEALLEYLRQSTLDIIFLDCRMSGMDGIDTARSIRTRNTKLTIIILTDYSRYALFGYDVGAFHYILKEQFYEKVNDVFDSAVRKVKDNESVTYTIKTSDGYAQIEVLDILYIECCLRKKSLLMIGNKAYDFYGKIEELEDDLKEHGFIRPHNSFLVNSRHIVMFNSDRIELVGGGVVPVSRGRYKPALDEFTVFSVR